MAQTTNKQYIWKVYKNGVYKATWTDIITDFSYKQMINSSASAITVQLARAADSFGEGVDVDFNNKVQVYIVDDQNPNGALIFQGFIANYKPVYGDTEYIEIDILGYGATFEDYMIESIELIDVNQNSQNFQATINNSSKSGIADMIYQSFTVGAGITKLSAISLTLAANAAKDVGAYVILNVYANQADCEANTNSLGSVLMSVTSTTAAVYKFTFATALTVAAAGVYYARLDLQTSGDPSTTVKVFYDTTAPYSGGSPKTGNFNGVSTTVWTALSGDLYLITYQNNGNTTVPFSSQDPSTILRTIIDNYNNQGGQITYTTSSIDTTGTTVSYQFQTNTTLEGINKCLELAPVGWYWYIDQANNVLHFHKRASTATHKLVLGKHIQNLQVDKRVQELVNIVYFIGGLVGSTNLYQKYILQASVDLYGRHAIKIVDNNVTNAATAQIIANAYLTDKSQINLRIDLDIVDDGGQTGAFLGFDIESITLGEMISFKGFGPGTGGSLWDVARWDQAKWDFDVTDLASVIVQVTEIDYKPDILHLSLSTVPPDVTKRIEDIRRNLDQLNVVNNPAAPS